MAADRDPDAQTRSLGEIIQDRAEMARQGPESLRRAVDVARWDTIVQSNKDATMERWRAEVSRLRNWIDTEGRNCPSEAAVDAVLEEGIRVAG